ncbi:C1 family peptidase [Chryseobacterium sp. Tr-659]|uniref:C1 family peptidase n=1 Tax=Chryseobacterium sp. Tr-659 TaxID=2608340 RepID=UPI00141F71F2|nr:C1 family peptidase [Chryseobacterium sp. Tr-659]NIF06171.1 C1 family peptidase [Chryseobacterium sp. Tr-659]
MRNLKIITLIAGIALLGSCQKNEEMDVKQPEPEQQIHAMGALFVNETTYESFEKVDVDALLLKYKGKNGASAKVVPSSYFVSGQPAVGNQGKEGSCVGWATAYAAASILEANFKGITQPRSPEYVYNQIKQGSCDAGSYPKDALNLIKNQGVCSLTEMPYNDTECSTQPNASQKNAASTHKFIKWATVSNSNINDVKNLLSMNLPVIIGITVDEEIKNLANTGWILKKRSGKVLGGHAICVVGYDDAKQAFKIQNSWGTSWADNGYFWIDYNFFAKNASFGGGVVRETYVAYVQ